MKSEIPKNLNIGSEEKFLSEPRSNFQPELVAKTANFKERLESGEFLIKALADANLSLNEYCYLIRDVEIFQELLSAIETGRLARKERPTKKNPYSQPERAFIKEIIKEALAAGATIRTSCLLAGIAKNTLLDWKEEDPPFAQELVASQKFGQEVRQAAGMFSGIRVSPQERIDKEEAIVDYILSGMTIGESCRQAELSISSYYRWFNESPAFAKRVNEAIERAQVVYREAGIHLTAVRYTPQQQTAAKKTVIASILTGATLRRAQKEAAISDNTFRRWRSRDEEFNQEVIEALSLSQVARKAELAKSRTQTIDGFQSAGSPAARSPEDIASIKKTIIRIIERGETVKEALSGLLPKTTYQRWRENDPQFRLAVEVAQKEGNLARKGLGLSRTSVYSFEEKRDIQNQIIGNLENGLTKYETLIVVNVSRNTYRSWLNEPSFEAAVAIAYRVGQAQRSSNRIAKMAGGIKK